MSEYLTTLMYPLYLFKYTGHPPALTFLPLHFICRRNRVICPEVFHILDFAECTPGLF